MVACSAKTPIDGVEASLEKGGPYPLEDLVNVILACHADFVYTSFTIPGSSTGCTTSSTGLLCDKIKYQIGGIQQEQAALKRVATTRY